ncbi:Bug family tripartite tricarboxylate transporter substrate binding protein [Hydrogenophaga sp.]|uniref:Bug family tripartite tricarboxylate transporter substrate binding protein n=1 Tax=Hydrogenophaga sp. TaxID=1904254 RepID=UPI003F6F8261
MDQSTFRMTRRGLLANAAAAAGTIALPVVAQGFPTRAIRIVVPYPAGGTTDILARLIGPKLQEALGQTVIVENKAGAATNLGAEFVARSPADGHTILLGTNVTFSVNPYLYRGLSFNAQRDFTPLVPIALTQTVLLVHPSVRANTVRDLIALAKEQPGKLNYGSYGSGSLAHLAAAQFATMAGIELNHVPYKGSAPAMTDLIGGHIQLMFDNIVTALPNAKAGSVKALAVSGARRSVAAPDLPTVAESAVKGYEVVGWFGFAAPGATPPVVTERLSKEINKILAQSEVRDRIIASGAEPMIYSQQEFVRFIQSDYLRAGELVRVSGAKAE